MSALRSALRPRHVPPLAPRVDWSHPVSRGLIFAVVPTRGGAAPRDLVSGVTATMTGTPTRARGGVDLDAGEDVRFALPDAPFLGALSVMWWGIIDSGATPAFLAKNLVTAEANPIVFGANNGLKHYVLRANAAATYREWQGVAIPTGKGVAVGFSAASVIETAPLVIADGVVSTATALGGSGTGAPTGVGSPVRLGTVSGAGSFQLDGVVMQTLAWSRALSAGEMRLLHADPYCVFA